MLNEKYGRNKKQGGGGGGGCSTMREGRGRVGSKHYGGNCQGGRKRKKIKRKKKYEYQKSTSSHPLDVASLSCAWSDSNNKAVLTVKSLQN